MADQQELEFDKLPRTVQELQLLLQDLRTEQLMLNSGREHSPQELQELFQRIMDVLNSMSEHNVRLMLELSKASPTEVKIEDGQFFRQCVQYSKELHKAGVPFCDDHGNLLSAKEEVRWLVRQRPLVPVSDKFALHIMRELEGSDDAKLSAVRELESIHSHQPWKRTPTDVFMYHTRVKKPYVMSTTYPTFDDHVMDDSRGETLVRKWPLHDEPQPLTIEDLPRPTHIRKSRGVNPSLTLYYQRPKQALLALSILEQTQSLHPRIDAMPKLSPAIEGEFVLYDDLPPEEALMLEQAADLLALPLDQVVVANRQNTPEADSMARHCEVALKPTSWFSREAYTLNRYEATIDGEVRDFVLGDDGMMFACSIDNAVFVMKV